MKKWHSYFLIFFLLLLAHGQVVKFNINSKDFSFVVLGDRTGTAEQEIFEQIIDRIKLLNPDFVINVGDLIEGYTQNVDMLNNQWAGVFATFGELKNKFFFTPGNHDAIDSISLRTYLLRIGYEKSYYSFSVGKNHFIVLDNSRQEKVDKPDLVQVEWLNKELSKYKKSDNIFCFMHRSYWKNGYNNNQPDTFHKLFVKYGVDYVFSGHDHFYCQQKWDGITYTQVGPSGSRLKTYFNKAYGAFQNFALVSVKNNKVQIKVITPDGKELDADCVTLDEIKELQNIEKAISITPVGFGQIESISVTVNNIFDMPFNTDLSWEINNNDWEIKPLSKSIAVSAKSSNTERFYCKIKSKNIYPLPKIQLSYPYANYKKTFNFDKRMPIKLISNCYKTKGKILIDGKIMEKAWQNNEPLDVFGSSDGNISETDPLEIYFAYDKNNLYIAGKITDYEPNKISASVSERDNDNIYQDDNINIILQPKMATDTYYQFFINPKGTVLDRICYLDGKTSKRDKKWNSEINVKTEISTGEMFYGWTFEMSLPLKQFDIIEPKSDWGFNLVRYQARTDKVCIYSVPFEHNPKTFAILKFSEK